jgi:hypothetical protein
MDFKEWLQQDTKVDEAEIDRVYDKAHIAVELVRQYNPQLLLNINTIANLASGAYGLYNSGENQQVLDPDVERRLIYWGKIPKNKIKTLPRRVIKQYFPNLDTRHIKITDTIRVNVGRILRESKTNLEAVLRIASTIIHESTHELGHTTEGPPQQAEQAFMNWAKQNLQSILNKYPVLRCVNSAQGGNYALPRSVNTPTVGRMLPSTSYSSTTSPTNNHSG